MVVVLSPAVCRGTALEFNLFFAFLAGIRSTRPRTSRLYARSRRNAASSGWNCEKIRNLGACGITFRIIATYDTLTESDFLKLLQALESKRTVGSYVEWSQIGCRGRSSYLVQSWQLAWCSAVQIQSRAQPQALVYVARHVDGITERNAARGLHPLAVPPSLGNCNALVRARHAPGFDTNPRVPRSCDLALDKKLATETTTLVQNYTVRPPHTRARAQTHTQR